ncbi:MAG: hypothetical protein QNL77_04855 [Akkermansiaceae bacterium]
MFPEVVQKIFSKAGGTDKLEFTSSWYHGPSSLPCYLSIEISPEDRDYEFRLLVDIESLIIMEAHVIHMLGKDRFQSFPNTLTRPESEKLKETAWDEMIGDWCGGGAHLSVTSDEVKYTYGDQILDDYTGQVTEFKKKAMLATADDQKRLIVFGLEKNLLFFEATYLAKVGSKEDKAALRRNANEPELETE